LVATGTVLIKKNISSEIISSVKSTAFSWHTFMGIMDVNNMLFEVPNFIGFYIEESNFM